MLYGRESIGGVAMQPTQDTHSQSALIVGNQNGERRISLVALLVIVGIVLYVILDVIAQLLPPHYNPITQAESDLAVGPYGFIMVINFVLRGLIALALLWVLTASLQKGVLSRTGLVLIGIWGVCSMLLALFPTDLADSKLTLHGLLHLVLALLAFICGAIGELIVSRSFAKDERWRSLSIIATVIATLAVIMFVPTTTGLFFHFLQHIGGLVERIFIGLVLLWMVVVAIHVRYRRK
jgi:hypothetical membrane protein